LAADSAVTRSVAEDSQLLEAPKDTTSFGELNVYESNRTVGEGALKIINLGQVAVAMCGDLRVGRSVVRTLNTAMEHGKDPQEALRVAVRTNGPFDDPERTIQLIVASPSSPKPTLLAFNSDGNQAIQEVQEGCAIHFGSLSPAYKSVTPQFIELLRGFTLKPQQLLVGTLALLQSYGIHEHILEEGVGGAFCGLLVQENSIEWQKDILFCIHRGMDQNFNMVSSIVRDDVLVVRSTLNNRCSYFGDSLNSGLDEKWRAEWWDPAFEFAKHGKFDFIVLLNTQFRIVTVIEMLKQQTSKHYRIVPAKGQRPEEAFRLDFAFSPTLTEDMIEPIADRNDGSMPLKFNWYPYEVANENGVLAKIRDRIVEGFIDQLALVIVGIIMMTLAYIYREWVLSLLSRLLTAFPIQ